MIRASESPSRPGDSPDLERASTVETIGLQALELARYARAAGFPAIGHILETAALEAAAVAATSRRPSDDAAR
jgi:hypothetical protein